MVAKLIKEGWSHSVTFLIENGITEYEIYECLSSKFEVKAFSPWYKAETLVELKRKDEKET